MRPVLLILSAMLGLALSAKAQQLRILSPADGQRLDSSKQANIEAQFEPPIDFTQPVSASVVATSETRTIRIAEGDLRSFAATDRIRAIWLLSDVKPGPYLIRVQVKWGEIVGSASVKVVVHPPPAVSMALKSVKKAGAGATAVFTAKVTSPVGAAIKEYVWTPGDGSRPVRTDSPTFTHTYRATGQTFVVWLEVHDVLGGSTLIARDLRIPAKLPDEQVPGTEEIFEKTTDCGCKKMTIRAKPGTSTGIYCSTQLAGTGTGCKEETAAPAGTCAAGEIAYSCPLGPVNPNPPAQPRLGHTFEVLVDLNPNTNDQSKCHEGQYARGTRVKDGTTIQNPVADSEPPKGPHPLPDGSAGGSGFTPKGLNPPDKYPPFAGPDYAGDDYTKPGTFKRKAGAQIFWNDEPGGPVGRNSRTQEDEFISFVEGPTGTCWCRFTVKQSWTAGGGAAGAGIELVDGSNCALENK